MPQTQRRPMWWNDADIGFGGVRPASVFDGTPGHDHILGTPDDDMIDLSQGGNDWVHARKGDDTIFVGAAYAPDDTVIGNSGFDTVVLDGDYSTGLQMTGVGLRLVDSLELRGGSYVITGMLGFENHYNQTLVDGRFLEAGETLDLQVASTGALHAIGGSGDDVLHAASNGQLSLLDGSSGDDILIGGAGFSSTVFWGGAGADVIEMSRSNAATDTADYYAGDSVRGSVDRIDGFNGSEDRVRILFDADTTKPAHQYGFHFGRTAERVGDVVFRYDAAHDLTVLKIFTDHDNKADFVLNVTGHVIGFDNLLFG